MDARALWRRFRASEEGRFLRQLALLAVAAPFIWFAVRPILWFAIPNEMLVSHIITYSGDTSSFDFWEMKRLLEWGADPDYVDQGVPILVRAGRRRHVEVAALLLSHGADRDAVDLSGVSALDAACRAGQDRMAAFLKAEGVPFTGAYQSTYDGRPLSSACTRSE